MSQTSTELIRLTPETAKMKLSIALSKIETGIQILHDKEAELVYNEDNLQAIADFIKEVKRAEDKVEAERKILKEPSFEEGKNIDAGANLIKSELFAIKKKAHEKYESMCKDIAEKQRQEKEKMERGSKIKNLIANAVLIFTEQIIAAKYDFQIVAIEKNMGLEKTRTAIYGEYLPELQAALTALQPLFKEQKEKIRELEKLKNEETAALESGNDERVLEIINKQEEVQQEFLDKKIEVQEVAASISAETTKTSVTTVFPSVKPKRTLLKFELVDAKETLKGFPEAINFELNTEVVKPILDRLRDSEYFKNNKETIINGIRYYKEEIW